MTTIATGGRPTAPTILTPDEQQAVWFLGALVRRRTTGEATAGTLAVLEHVGNRGYCSPLHRHGRDEETFLVLDGELRIDVESTTRMAGPGTAAVLPRGIPHAFVVTSPNARFLTIHTPAGFDIFARQAGTPAVDPGAPPPDLLPPDPAALTAMAAAYGIDIIGPPPG